MNIREQLAANIIRCRQRAGISQEELGFRSSLHRTEIGMLERGLRMPGIDTVIKLAAAMEIEITDLVAGINWEARQMSAGNFVVSTD